VTGFLRRFSIRSRLVALAAAPLRGPADLSAPQPPPLGLLALKRIPRGAL
jgi:hypothetical protein